MIEENKKFRTKDQRKDEIKEIIKQLSQLKLTPHYQPMKELYVQFKRYIELGNKLKINIPFPAINRRIKGVLAINTNEEVWIEFKNEKFN